jgi:enoyl-CoA hydratase
MSKRSIKEQTNLSKKSNYIEIIFIKSKETLKWNLPERRADREIRVIILEFADEELFSSENELDEELVKQIENSTVPVITIIKNKAAKILFEIVLASHLCLASDSAIFEIINKERVKKIIGSKNAGKVDLSGKVFDAETAFGLGLINRIVSADNLENEAFVLAQQISKLAPLAIESCLKAVTQGFDTNLEKGLELETELFSQIFATADMKEGTQAFLEKREPHFRGR